VGAGRHDGVAQGGEGVSGSGVGQTPGHLGKVEAQLQQRGRPFLAVQGG